MKLIIHPGLHKSGSTYLQHAMNDNHQQLRTRGVYYQHQRGYPAHHHAAWQVLEGDAEPLMTMLAEAHMLGCETVVFSSEDMEGALFDDRPIHAIETAAQAAGYDEVEWHLILRDPGEYFASLFAQLQHHVYADAFALFYDVMRRGYIHIPQPMPGSGTPYWYYAFDHDRDLDRLASRISGTVIAHDFRAQGPFPGHQILAGAGCLDAIKTLPGNTARNARPDRDAIIQGYVERVAEAVPAGTDQSAILDGFLTCLESGLDHVQTYARIVGERYGASHRSALNRFCANQIAPPVNSALSQTAPIARKSAG